MTDKLIIDCSTGEQTLEPLTSADLTQQQTDQQIQAASEAAQAATQTQISTNASPLKSNLVPIANLLIGAPTPWPTQAQIEAIQNGTATIPQAQAVLAGVLRALGHLMLVMSADGGLG